MLQQKLHTVNSNFPLKCDIKSFAIYGSVNSVTSIKYQCTCTRIITSVVKEEYIYLMVVRYYKIQAIPENPVLLILIGIMTDSGTMKFQLDDSWHGPEVARVVTKFGSLYKHPLTVMDINITNSTKEQLGMQSSIMLSIKSSFVLTTVTHIHTHVHTHVHTIQTHTHTHQCCAFSPNNRLIDRLFPNFN